MKRKPPKKKIRLNRNGKPRKKFVKPTVEEYDERVDQIMAYIADKPNVNRYELHRIFCPKFDVRWETIDRYLTRAREQLRERLSRSREEIRSNAVAFYEALIGNEKVQSNVRLKAQQALVDLMGASAPAKIEISGPQGAPIQTENTTTGSVDLLLSALTADELKQIIEKLNGDGMKDE